jgi:magnesium transporter
MSDIRFYHITANGKIDPADTLKQAVDATALDGFTWIDYTEPTREELSTLIDPLGLHPLSIEDCTDENQIPKIEDYPNHTFILVNAFVYSGEELVILEVDMFIGDKFLVTVSQRGPDGQSLLAGYERYIETDLGNACQGPAYLAHVILDRIVDQKFISIEALEEQLNDAEDILMEDLDRFDPSNLLHMRRELLSLRKSLFHEREVLVKILRRDSKYIPEVAMLYYRDIYDHLAKFFELTESSREIVTTLMEMYLSLLNNRMSKSANDMNATVRRLTFITTIFMPLTLLAGIGGMSEWSMMTGPENWKIAYPLFLLGMVVLGGFSYFLLKLIEKHRRHDD